MSRLYIAAEVVAALLVLQGSALTLRGRSRQRLAAAFDARRGNAPAYGTGVYKTCSGIDCYKAYIAEEDPTYRWYDTKAKFRGVDEKSSVGFTGYVVNMTSQRWLSEAMISNPEWWHLLVVVVPDNLENKSDWLTMVIESGINHEEIEMVEHVSPREPPDEKRGITYKGETLHDHLEITTDNLLEMLPKLKWGAWKTAHIATHTKALAASLYSALNDWEIYGSDPAHIHRTDDGIKSYSWVEYLKHGGVDVREIMELAVAKAAARALDALQGFTETLPSGRVQRFGIIGYSKYGSCTWTMGAIGDPRIKAIAPAALPLDFIFLAPPTPGPSLMEIPEVVGTNYEGQHNPVDDWKDWKDHHKNKIEEMATSYDELPFVMISSDPNASAKLLSIIDPWFFRDNMTIPKFFVQTTNDVWFPLDIVAHVKDWWPLVPEPKSLYMATTEHDNALTYHGGLGPASAFMRTQILGQPMPKISWSAQTNSSSLATAKGKSITITQASDDLPVSVNLISAATNCSASGAQLLRATFYKDDNLLGEQKDSELAGGISGQGGSLHRLSWTAQVVKPGAKLLERTAACPKAAFVTAEYAGSPGGDDIRISSPLYMM